MNYRRFSMKQNTALMISLVLTAFVLTLVAGVVFAVRGVAGKSQDAAVATDPASAAQDAASAPASDVQNLQQALQARDAAYQNIIDQANARLEQAQKEQQALQDQIDTLQANAASNAAPAPVGISPQDAAQIAALFMGRSDLYSVESDTYNDASAYKVTFSSGDILWVDMNGEVMNVQLAPTITSSSNGSGFGSGHEFHEHEGENEGHGKGGDD
jgi:hypothetical protein